MIYVNVDLGQYLADINPEMLVKLQMGITVSLPVDATYPQCLPRSELPAYLHLINARNGVEIGVQRGEYAKYLLSNWPGKLYLVDPWRHLDKADYIDVANVSDEEHAVNYQAALENLAGFEQRYQVIRDISIDAARLFPDGSLDFVFLDGDHSYSGTRCDLTAWLPKIRQGGLIAGHDFMNYDGPLGSFRVRSAVTEFVAEYGYRLYVSREPWPSLWYFIKRQSTCFDKEASPNDFG